MTTDLGRVPAEPGSQASPSAADASSPVGADPSRDEFCIRFKARMLAVAGSVFDDGDSIAEYADDTAASYYETDWQHAEGPEACADADISYWGE